MNLRFVTSAVFAVALCAAACAQDANPALPDNQAPGMGQGGHGQRGDRGGMGMMVHMVAGDVTEAAADHFTIKTFYGEVYTVHFSANTRFMKGGGMGTGMGGGGWRRGGEGQGGGEGMRQGGGNPPQPIKATDIKVGDTIGTSGEIDAAAKSVGAVGVFLINPDAAKQMKQMAADYGKTWLAGKVTSIDGVQITLEGSVDSAAHTFAADENTTFRERRNPVTLADIKVGDMVRVEGAMKDGAFIATTVNVMRMQGETRVPRDAPQ